MDKLGCRFPNAIGGAQGHGDMTQKNALLAPRALIYLNAARQTIGARIGCWAGAQSRLISLT